MPTGFRNLSTGLFKCYSSAGPGSLGEIPEGYEEVPLQGPLTSDQVEPIPLTEAQQMEAIFRDLPVELRNLFANDRSMIKACLDLNPIDWELIEHRIQSIPIPVEHPELASLKTALLALIPREE